MVRIEVTRIKIGQTDELLTGQGGFLAFGESMKGMRLEERVMHLPAPGCNRGFDPGVSVRTSVSLQILGGQILPELRDLEREKTRPGLLDQTVIPDEDTVGQWLRRTGVPEKKQAGLAGLGGRPPDRWAPGLIGGIGSCRGRSGRKGATVPASEVMRQISLTVFDSGLQYPGTCQAGSSVGTGVCP